ncbi:MAG: DUF5106 domain-containing protein [Bacteroidales bacterium]
MKKIFLIACALCMGIALMAQKGHKIEIQVKGLSDTTLLLGHHYGSKKLVSDTIHVDKKGYGVVEGDTLLNPGIYLVLTPEMRFFEIIIDKDQHFKVVTNVDDLFGNLTVKKSEENEVFHNYQLQNAQINKTRRPIVEKLKTYMSADTSEYSQKQLTVRRDSISILREELEELNVKRKELEKNIIEEYPESLLASVLNTMSELEVPDYPRDEDGNITDSLFKYNYMREHYFDRVDFADDRLLRTPVYEMKINQYFDKELIQVPDSIIPEVNRVLGRILEEEDEGYEGEVYYFTLHNLFMKYQNPKYMGFDNIFVYLIEQYYLKNKVPERIATDSAYMAQIEDRYKKMSKNRIGVTAPDLQLYSNNDTWKKINSIEADVTMLYFYDIDCGHCKKVIPEWHTLYTENNLREKGVETVYIYTQTDMEKWKEFINEKKLESSGIHLFDPYQNTDFRTLYDIYSTPVSYILDKDKKIVAKRLPPETILEVVQHELGIEDTE